MSDLRQARWAAGAIAAAGVVAVVAVALARNDDPTRVVAAGSGEADVPLLVPTAVPEGYALERVTDLPVDLSAPGEPYYEPRLWLFAEDPGEPAAGRSVGVVVTRVDPSGLAEPGAGPETPGELTVQGRPAHRFDSALGFQGISWVHEPGVRVALFARGLSDEELLETAESVRVADGATSVELEGAALDLGQVVADAPVPMLSAQIVPPSSDGYVTTYVAPSDPDTGDQRIMLIGATVDDPTTATVWRWFLADADASQVRGRSATVGSMPGGESVSGSASSDGEVVAERRRGEPIRIATWVEAPGVRVTVLAMGPSEAEVLDLAESLRAVSAAEWESYRASAQPGLLDAHESGATAEPAG